MFSTKKSPIAAPDTHKESHKFSNMFQSQQLAIINENRQFFGVRHCDLYR